MSGRTILHYEIREKIGEGGMGVVYSALDRKLNRTVALKFLPAHLAASPDNLDRFRREASAISTLNHARVATLYDIEHEAGEQFLVLEYLGGGTLKSKIQGLNAAGRKLSIADALRYAIGVADGLAHAHRRGVVHRDIKTSNLMLTEEGDVKITDFGLACSGDGEEDRMVIGTLSYMAPEQARGEAADARSDLFSFGVVLFELVTGRLPVEGAGQAELLDRVQHEPAPRLQTYRADSPEGLERIVARCLDKRPRDRYQTMDEVAADLRRLSESLADATQPLTVEPVRRPGRWSRRLWLSVAALVAVCGLALALPIRTQLAEWLTAFRGRTTIQLAVLPFRSIGGDAAVDVLSAGLMDILTNKLAQLEQFQASLEVISASEVRAENIASAREARTAFGATHALAASVQRDEGAVIVALSLVDTTTQIQVAAHTIEHRVDNLSALQELLVQTAADMLELQFAPEARRALAAGLTQSPAAYNLYLTGRGYLLRHDRAENLDRAVATFEEALKQDAAYALAHAGTAEARWRQYQLTRDPQWLDAARASSQRAMALNDRLTPVLVTQGLIDTAAGRTKEAIQVFQKALDTEPRSVDALRGLAAVHGSNGDLPQAEATYRRAVKLRPNSWNIHRDLGMFYFTHGRFKESVASFEQVIRLTPDNYRGYNNLGAIYLRMGRHDEAERQFQRSLAIRPVGPTYSNLGTIYYFQGRYAEAAVMYEKAAEMTPKDARVWGNLGDAHRWTPGASQRALEAYRKAIELGRQELAANPKNARLRSGLAMYLVASGDPDGARAEIQQALKLAPKDGLVLYRAALVEEQTGRRDRALDMLAAAFKAGQSVEEVRRAPPLKDLRSDPRYQVLEKQHPDSR